MFYFKYKPCFYFKSIKYFWYCILGKLNVNNRTPSSISPSPTTLLPISLLSMPPSLPHHLLFGSLPPPVLQVQGKDPSVDITQELVDESEEERFDDMSSPGLELPPCELSRLEDLAEMVASSLPSPLRREKLALAVENEGRSEERRVGKECLRLCRSRWAPYH